MGALAELCPKHPQNQAQVPWAQSSSRRVEHGVLLPMWPVVLTICALNTSPVDVLQRWRHARLKAFSNLLHEGFGSTSEMGTDAVAHRYHVRALVVDSGGGASEICAELISSVAAATGASRHLQLYAASTVQKQGESAGYISALEIASKRTGLAMEPSQLSGVCLRPCDLEQGGAYDLILTTDIDVLSHVRSMATEAAHGAAPQVRAFCLTDFALSGDTADADTAIAAVIALPPPLRRILAAHPGGLSTRMDLPRAPAEDWDDYLGLATARALGFTMRLKQSIVEHARKMLMCELVATYPNVESLSRAPIEAHARESFSGGLSAKERSRIMQAFVAYLHRREGVSMVRNEAAKRRVWGPLSW